MNNISKRESSCKTFGNSSPEFLLALSFVRESPLIFLLLDRTQSKHLLLFVRVGGEEMFLIFHQHVEN